MKFEREKKIVICVFFFVDPSQVFQAFFNSGQGADFFGGGGSGFHPGAGFSFQFG